MTTTTPKVTIKEIKENNPLPNIAEQYQVELKRSGQNLMGRCPFHPDKKPSLSISIRNSGWQFKCFSGSCGKSGDVIDFVGLKIFGDSWNNRDTKQFQEVLEELGGTDKGSKRAISKPKWDITDFKESTYKEITNHVILTWDISLGLYADILMKTSDVIKYVKGRGFTNETIRKFRFGFCPPDGSQIEHLVKLSNISQELLLKACIMREIDHDGNTRTYEYFWNRITFTDKSMGRESIYPMGRIFPNDKEGGQSAKYMGPAEYQKPVFNINGISRQKKAPVFIVEAPWDAITLVQLGFDAVAIMGAHPSDFQKKELNRLAASRNLIPIPDNDKGGEIALGAWQDNLNLEEPLVLPKQVGDIDIKDPNDLICKIDPEKGKKLFKELASQRGIVGST